jgi:hypothetical protein
LAERRVPPAFQHQEPGENVCRRRGRISASRIGDGKAGAVKTSEARNLFWAY